MLHKYIKLLIPALLLTLGTACVPGGRQISTDKPASPNLVNQENGDEEEYELIIFDNNFDRWFITNSRPINYYSPSFYEQWNQRYVAAWNEKVNQQINYNTADYPFENRIEYNTGTDYGLELNYRLFWYFRYIEDLYGARYNFPGFRIRNL